MFHEPVIASMSEERMKSKQTESQNSIKSRVIEGDAEKRMEGGEKKFWDLCAVWFFFSAVALSNSLFM